VGGSVLRMSRGLNGHFRIEVIDIVDLLRTFRSGYHPSPPGRHVLGVRCIGVWCECPRTRCSGLGPKHGAPVRSGLAASATQAVVPTW
jgi:hypothetical protein